MPTNIRPEQPDDRDALRAIHLRAFPTAVEADLVDALRGGFIRLSLVAETEGRVVGHILFSDLTIVGSRVSALALAPLAVTPEHQRRGIGSDLVRRGLDECRRAGFDCVIVLGEPAFYGRFGFSAAKAARLESPYAGEYFQAIELTPGALDGVAGRVEYAPPFADLS